jgi:hypothetical protein
MCGIQPGNASTPAESSDQLVRISSVAGCPAGDVVQIGQYLRVRHFGDKAAEQRDIGKVIGIAFAKIEFWCDSQIPFQSQAAANVTNVLMNTKISCTTMTTGSRPSVCFGRA